MEQFKTPILFLIFNRPKETREVFSAIKNIKPKKLFIAADGPRKEKVDDIKKCEEVRNITKDIDWNCEVKTLFREKNLGCKMAVSSAIDWFFGEVEEGVILEDDCLPNKSFFDFCDKMLGKYRDEEKVMLITGTNHLGRWKENKQSYFFSIYGGIWGWASWKRAWKHYDVNMKMWSNQNEREKIKKFISDEEQYKFRETKFDKVFKNQIDTWDYQWGFARMINNGLSIVPSLNLIQNIGSGPNSTHRSENHLKNKVFTLPQPFFYNGKLKPDRKFDQKVFRKVFQKKDIIFLRILRKIKEKLKK